jgi:LPXTG-motif cell wall-anchored protein
MALGTIMGAIFAHLFVIGLQITNPDTGEMDGGLLFALALMVAAGSAFVLGQRWRELPLIGQFTR